ncbi:hypothetical protein [Aeromonas bestiarum]|uniref:hypothetical protein n=1 Tax=Aeromonas bestiarum TaxID=105751 RepID=UPI003D22E75A
MSGRKPIPNSVKKVLRTEVGFGCPVKGCGNPYLEYHHFDPPVSVKPHNNPEGMIALCAQHHKKADGGAYTVEQLHALKRDTANANLVRGNLDWLRKDLLAVVGGNFYYETPKIITIDNVDLVSLVRDEDGYLRLNVNMLSLEPEERIIIENNSWENIGSPIDLRSPPQGKELEVSYPNGDYLYLRFIEIKSEEQAVKRYGHDFFSDLVFPLTTVEVNMTIAGTRIELTPESSKIGMIQMTGNISKFCGCGVLIENSGVPWRQNPIWKRQTLVEETEHPNVLKVNFGRR